jgi:hypothetical protein
MINFGSRPCANLGSGTQRSSDRTLPPMQLPVGAMTSTRQGGGEGPHTGFLFQPCTKKTKSVTGGRLASRFLRSRTCSGNAGWPDLSNSTGRKKTGESPCSQGNKARSRLLYGRVVERAVRQASMQAAAIALRAVDARRDSRCATFAVPRANVGQRRCCATDKRCVSKPRRVEKVHVFDSVHRLEELWDR